MIVLVLAACGGGHHAPDGAVGDGDATTVTITGRDVARDVRCIDATRVPSVIDEPFQTLDATAIAADGTTTSVPVAADGTFSFTAPAGARYRLSTTADGGGTVEYQLAAPMLDIGARIVGRYPRTAAPAGTTLTASITGNVPGGGYALIGSVGLWNLVIRTSGNNQSFTVPWTQAVSLSGTVGLIDASAYDRVYWLAADVAGAAPQYYTLTNACSEDFTMVAGTANTLTCAAAPVTQDHCVHVTAHVVDEAARLAAAAPANFTTQGWAWQLFAIPAPALGPIGGLSVAYYPSNGMPTDVDRDVTFGVPFPGHDVALQLQLLRGRTLALGSAQATTIYANTTHLVKPAGDCTTPSVIAGSIAIPTQPALDGVGLSADHTELSLDRTRQHALTWDVAAAGTHDYWAVRLFELTAPNNQTELDVRGSWVTDITSLVVDPAVFIAGSTYLIEVEGVSAYANAAGGDFRTPSYPASPYAVSSILSGTFVVDN